MLESAWAAGLSLHFSCASPRSLFADPMPANRPISRWIAGKTFARAKFACLPGEHIRLCNGRFAMKRTAAGRLWGKERGNEQDHTNDSEFLEIRGGADSDGICGAHRRHLRSRHWSALQLRRSHGKFVYKPGVHNSHRQQRRGKLIRRRARIFRDSGPVEARVTWEGRASFSGPMRPSISPGCLRRPLLERSSE